MANYDAARSLVSVLKQLRDSSDEYAMIVNQESLPFIEHLRQMAVSIKTCDFERDYRQAKSFAKEMRDTLWRAENIIQSHMLTHLLSSEDNVESFSKDLLQVIEEIKTAKEKLDKFENYDIEHGIREDSIPKFGGYVISSSDELPPRLKNKMVGLRPELRTIKEIISSESRQDLGAFLIYGMGGIGKTSLAISIYNDSDIRNYFYIVAWVELSLDHCIRDILLNLIHTVEIHGNGRLKEKLSHRALIEETDDEGLEDLVWEIFSRERYLVIVDCLCDVNEDSWEYIRNLLPDSKNRSRIILVNRMLFECDDFVLYDHAKWFLESKDSWDLLRECVFGEEPWPRELRKIAERIATNCQGLPLAIITVGKHLAKEKKKVEYWDKVAEWFYNDSDICSYFPIVSWVTLYLDHRIRDILLNLIHTVEIHGNGRLEEMISQGALIDQIDDKGLADLVRKIFDRERYLVMVHYLCEVDENSWEYIKNLLPDSNNGSRIILINRMIFECDDFILYDHAKCFLEPKDCWNLLKECVFGEDSSRSEQHKTGERITKNCQGLPLAITTLKKHLAKGKKKMEEYSDKVAESGNSSDDGKEKKMVEYWNRVAESGNSLAYMADGAPMFEQLCLSYKNLPQRVRLGFLYMGVFPEKHLASELELSYLWDAEGLAEGDTDEWMDYLYNRSLFARDVVENGVVGYSLHHAMWHFCCSKAEEEEFFHVLDKYWSECKDPQDVNPLSIRRLVIRNTVIFAIKNICQINDLVCSGIRSLQFTGPYHPYPLGQILCDSYKMLRVLNARSICFYEFPDEILCLQLLHYLSLTLNGGELPPGISKIKRSLQFLIVHFHHIVRSFGGDPKYMPMEIWKMQQLQHLEVIGFDLPIPPPHSDDQLTNLATLCGVSPQSCKTEVLERIPNLTELRIRIDLAPENDAEGPPLCPFDHLAAVQQLKWLHCVITNPYFEVMDRPQVDAMLNTFSVSLNKLALLNLSGCGFPWEKIEQISKLPSLVILYLKCHAFRGPEWELTSNGFERLEILVLEDLDLECWKTSSENDKIFPRLCSLRISNCQKLKQVPRGFVHCPDLQGIDVMDSSFEVETWARSVQTELSRTQRTMLVVSSPRGASSRLISDEY